MSQPYLSQCATVADYKAALETWKRERANLAYEIANAMREAYEEEGIEGDFDDAARYLRDDASDEELQAEKERWLSKHENS